MKTLEQNANVDPVDYMAIWEAILETKLTCDEDSFYYSGNVGICVIRDHVADVTAPLIMAAYEHVSDDYDAPFDWEFCPAAISILDELREEISPESLGEMILENWHQGEIDSTQAELDRLYIERDAIDERTASLGNRLNNLISDKLNRKV